eukprot:TRINITY_DN5758_c1_g4_i3.p1 TRINITY_DN5758_c1_g4~~TRINITY_DN5758_c1_g4_i3.p1  ORF type:complete len:1538 (-),score=343.92 TRINITY_DN5758_c1_g4_i3:1818-6431(-)
MDSGAMRPWQQADRGFSASHASGGLADAARRRRGSNTSSVGFSETPQRPHQSATTAITTASLSSPSPFFPAASSSCCSPSPRKNAGRRASAGGSSGDGDDEVKVIVRVRPPLEAGKPLSYFVDEADSTKLLGAVSELSGAPSASAAQNCVSVEELAFSRVVGPAEDNRRTFETLGLRELIGGIVRGFQETLFAYGQTGSGKTHTILGDGGDYGEPGLLQLCTRELLDLVFGSPRSGSSGSSGSGSGGASTPDDTRRYVQLMCLEIKNEEVIDLLPATLPSNLARGGAFSAFAASPRGEEDAVRESICVRGRRSTYRKVAVWSYEEAMWLLRGAIASREVGRSSVNSESSRSHMVVRFIVKTFCGAAPGGGSAGSAASTSAGSTAGTGDAVVGSLTLVDLAGNEREGSGPNDAGGACTSSSSYCRKEEAKAINVSLTHLNRMLVKMQSGRLDESDRRQGSLNMVLYESLVEDCGVTMVFCIHPDQKYAAAARSTLQMAMQCRRIVRRRCIRRLEATGYKDELADLRVEASALTRAHSQALAAQLRKEAELRRIEETLEDMTQRYEVKSREYDVLRASLEAQYRRLSEEDQEKQRLVGDLARKNDILQGVIRQLQRRESELSALQQRYAEACLGNKAAFSGSSAEPLRCSLSGQSTSDGDGSWDGSSPLTRGRGVPLEAVPISSGPSTSDGNGSWDGSSPSVRGRAIPLEAPDHDAIQEVTRAYEQELSALREGYEQQLRQLRSHLAQGSAEAAAPAAASAALVARDADLPRASPRAAAASDATAVEVVSAVAASTGASARGAASETSMPAAIRRTSTPAAPQPTAAPSPRDLAGATAAEAASAPAAVRRPPVPHVAPVPTAPLSARASPVFTRDLPGAPLSARASPVRRRISECSASGVAAVMAAASAAAAGGFNGPAWPVGPVAPLAPSPRQPSARAQVPHASQACRSAGAESGADAAQGACAADSSGAAEPKALACQAEPKLEIWQVASPQRRRVLQPPPAATAATATSASPATAAALPAGPVASPVPAAAAAASAAAAATVASAPVPGAAEAERALSALQPPWDVEVAESSLSSLVSLQGRLPQSLRHQCVEAAVAAMRRFPRSLRVLRDASRLLGDAAAQDTTLREIIVGRGAVVLAVGALQSLPPLARERGPGVPDDDGLAAETCSGLFRALAVLCQKNPGHQQAVRAAGGLDETLRCLSVPALCGGDAAVHGCWLLMTLCNKHPENQDLVRLGGGLDRLLVLLATEVSAAACAVAAETSGDPSRPRSADAAEGCRAVSATLCAYVCGAIASATEGNTESQQFLCEAAAIPMLVRTLSAFLHSPHVVSNACVALAHIAHRHPASQRAARSPGIEGPRVILEALLAYRGHAAVQAGICRAVAVFSEQCPANAQAFLQARLPDGRTSAEVGVLSLLLSAARDAGEDDLTVTTACWALESLLAAAPGARDELRMLGGLERILELLRHFDWQERSTEYICRLLAELVRGDGEAARANRTALRALGAHEAIVSAARKHAKSQGFALVRARDALQGLQE